MDSSLCIQYRLCKEASPLIPLDFFCLTIYNVSVIITYWR